MDSSGGDAQIVIESREDLLARVTWANEQVRFMLRAFEVFRAYGVDFTALPEWQDQSALADARRLRPAAAQSKIVAYFTSLRRALDAAVSRRNIKNHGVIPGGRGK